ncbi:MAG: hypothetical protein LBP53_01865 [Candidatus Peribacteria bacterium]|jgi:hypothetical protein|nr:hypothetical protein [Candidatus Peribacteria bacterium]
MKTISYQTMVRQLLGEEEFLAFEQCYRQPVQKSIHLIKSRERHVSTQSLLENEGWKFSPPAFSFQ